MAKKAFGKPRVLVVDDGTTYTEVIAERMPEVELVDPAPFGEMRRLIDGPSALKYLARGPGGSR